MKRHRFDPVSFVWGVLFVGLGLAVLNDTIHPSPLGLRAFWPLVMVALGLAVVSSLRRNSRTEDDESSLPSASDHT